MRKESLAGVVLEKLAELGRIPLDAFFPPTYSYTKMWRPLLGLDAPPQITRHAVSMNLWRLQKQGLVKKSGKDKASRWGITSKGKKYLRSAEAGKIDLVKDGVTRIVMFDIPERERKKRDIIRAELIGYGFSQLQKSVWIGEYRLPEEFITLIGDLDLSDCVHIFSVREKGTIARIGA